MKNFAFMDDQKVNKFFVNLILFMHVIFIYNSFCQTVYFTKLLLFLLEWAITYFQCVPFCENQVDVEI